MTKLEQFIENRLNMVKDTSDTDFAKFLFHQAFGAVEFACLLYPEHEIEISEWWNNNKWNEFWDIIGG